MTEDKKINDFLKQNLKPCPEAPRDEYQRILSKLEKKPFIFSLKAMSAVGASVVLVLLLAIFVPYGTPKQNLQVENEKQTEEWLHETFSDYATSFEESELL